MQGEGIAQECGSLVGGGGHLRILPPPLTAWMSFACSVLAEYGCEVPPCCPVSWHLGALQHATWDRPTVYFCVAIDEHLGSFQFGTIMGRGAMNILELGTCFCRSLTPVFYSP